MNLISLKPFTLALLWTLVLSNPAFSDWDAIQPERHSFKDLGGAFFKDVTLHPVEGANLILFNKRAALELGLTVPDDPALLAKIVLEKFAYFIPGPEFSPPDASPTKTFFSTYYQDSVTKAVGDARGDGRAVWAGEIIVRDNYYVDVVLKGIGATSLAWTNHADLSHKDGLQSLNEAVYSYVMSEANHRNQLDTTVDLAVILLPPSFVKRETSGPVRAAITVRVGNQTRMAHFRYFGDSMPLFGSIFEYSVKRDLHMPLANSLPRDELTLHYGGSSVKIPTYLKSYLDAFTDNVAEEAARYYDLHAVHGAPTHGNRTTQGSTIDMGTWKYLDAHHESFMYLRKAHPLSDQKRALKEYATHDLVRFLTYRKESADPAKPEDPRYLFLSGDEEDTLQNYISARFNAAFNSVWSHLLLARLGVRTAKDGVIPQEAQDDFRGRSEKLMTHQESMTQDIESQTLSSCARFLYRDVFKETLKILSDSQFMDLYQAQLGKQAQIQAEIQEVPCEGCAVGICLFGVCEPTQKLSPKGEGYQRELLDLRTKMADYFNNLADHGKFPNPYCGSKKYDTRDLTILFPFFESAKKVVESLCKEADCREKIAVWIANAEIIDKKRLDLKTTRRIREAVNQPLLKLLADRAPFNDVEKQAELSIEAWVDHGLPERTSTNLGRKATR